MSLLADPADRVEWYGEDVDTEQLAERLLRMNHDHARHAHGHAATRTLNLLVAPSADVTQDALAQRLGDLSTRHPSRTIVVREHAQSRLDATLTIECSISAATGAAGYCHDTAFLRADAARLRHADSLVHPLRVGGLPTVLWLPGAQARAAEPSLARIADAVVLDSGTAADAWTGLACAAGINAVARVRDLAWLRLTRWRQRVAARFDDPAARASLSATERVELRCAGLETATPLLLVGWIVARAGWTFVALERTDGRWHGTARRQDGGTVAITIGAPTGEPPGIHVLTFTTADASIEIAEPVAEPGDARTFAAALGTFDEPSPGYAPALAALTEGLDER